MSSSSSLPKGPVPVVHRLADMYYDDEFKKQARRWIELLDKHKELHGADAEFVARSPGRVNIIGEHIDYSLFPVLPMAISADVLLAVSYDSSSSTSSTSKDSQKGLPFRIKINNVQDEDFPGLEFELPGDTDVPIDVENHHWTNYFKCGLRGALEMLRRKHGSDYQPRGMCITVNGTVPPGGGLSSSAAFVTASALAVLVANGERNVDKLELTEVAIVSERAVGVNSGGMDQSASVLSEAGAALFVEFSPGLAARNVYFPKTNLVFMIAQSFCKADKKVSGPIHYNLRVVECSLAALVLHRALCPGVPEPQDDSPLGISLGTVFDTYWEQQPRRTEQDKNKTRTQKLEEYVKLVDEVFKETPTPSREDIAKAVDCAVDDLEQQFIRKRFPVTATRFKLRDRAFHVYTEALRVYRFMNLLEDPESSPTASEDNNNNNNDDDDAVDYNARLGKLLNESQDSLRDNFDASIDELDTICKIARKEGSVGSRLTGAGWGGATVHMVPEGAVEGVKRALMDEYYEGRSYGGKKLTEDHLDAAVVVSRPGRGSTLWLPPSDQPYSDLFRSEAGIS